MVPQSSKTLAAGLPASVQRMKAALAVCVCVFITTSTAAPDFNYLEGVLEEPPENLLKEIRACLFGRFILRLGLMMVIDGAGRLTEAPPC